MEKKCKNQLINELDAVKDQFATWEKRMRKLDLHIDLVGATNFLSELVQFNFYNMLNTLAELRETYCKQGIA